jgi:CubicO group peptidase (beta-lactamase class C family)
MAVQKQNIAKLLRSLLLSLVFFLTIAVPSQASELPSETFQIPLVSPTEQPDITPIVPPRHQRGKPTDLEELRGFVNQFFEQQLEEEHVPGVAITIVQDGEIVVSQGYGYANLEKEIPVDPERTLFRMASLSKLFTDTAMMQLYERGILDLNADINDYLDEIEIDNGYPEPITPANLLTQTEGTSQRLIGIGARTEGSLKPLEAFIPEKMPPFAWEPGELYSYSNMGVTLAGYLVQEVSETPYLDYIPGNLLEPLDMTRSTFLQPPPPELLEDLATGYQYRSGQNGFESVPYLYLNIFPAAALSATATDMAHFMIAHLEGGEYEGERILEPDTVELMHEQHFIHFPGLPGSAYGFHERLENGLRGIGHAGSLRGYSSNLSLFPEEDLGIFIATNSYNNIHEEFIKQFLDHYYPVEPVSVEPTLTQNFQPERFTGTYRDLEYPKGSFAKLSAPFGYLNVNANQDNILEIKPSRLFFPGELASQQITPVPDIPLLFQHLDDGKLTAFGKDEEGEITYLFNPIRTTIGAYVKISWWEGVYFQLGLGLVCVLIFVAGVVSWLLGWFNPQEHKPRKGRKSGRIVRFFGGLVSSLHLVFIIGFPLSLWLYGVWKLVYGIPWFARIFLYLPVVAIALTVPLLFFLGLAWLKGYGTLKARAYYGVVTLGAIAFIPFLWYWNLV